LRTQRPVSFIFIYMRRFTSAVMITNNQQCELLCQNFLSMLSYELDFLLSKMKSPEKCFKQILGLHCYSDKIEYVVIVVCIKNTKLICVELFIDVPID